jgi:cellulose synthase/poly-beta-1,6-N-acetylglucosamine synthase-like glycosyltransferase
VAGARGAMSTGPGTGRRRPAVSVIVPFAGDAEAAARLFEALRALEREEPDELIVADNSIAGSALALAPTGSGVQVVRAAERRSSYHARNVGARRATADWLLFIDADCRPTPTLLADYLAEPVADRVGALAGVVEPVGEGGGTVARHARSRPYLDQASFLAEPRGAFAATANLMVRRAVWAALDGFEEVRSGGDVDFSWRLQDAGWSIELRPAARVRHRHRETLSALVRQRVRYGAGERWLARRRPERRSGLAILPVVARRLASAAALGVRGRREPALFNLLDAVAFGAEALGWLFGNAPKPWPRETRERRGDGTAGSTGGA